MWVALVWGGDPGRWCGYVGERYRAQAHSPVTRVEALLEPPALPISGEHTYCPPHQVVVRVCGSRHTYHRKGCWAATATASLCLHFHADSMNTEFQAFPPPRKTCCYGRSLCPVVSLWCKPWKAHSCQAGCQLEGIQPHSWNRRGQFSDSTVKPLLSQHTVFPSSTLLLCKGFLRGI